MELKSILCFFLNLAPRTGRKYYTAWNHIAK